MSISKFGINLAAFKFVNTIYKIHKIVTTNKTLIKYGLVIILTIYISYKTINLISRTSWKLHYRLMLACLRIHFHRKSETLLYLVYFFIFRPQTKQTTKNNQEKQTVEFKNEYEKTLWPTKTLKLKPGKVFDLKRDSESP